MVARALSCPGEKDSGDSAKNERTGRPIQPASLYRAVSLEPRASGAPLSRIEIARDNNIYGEVNDPVLVLRETVSRFLLPAAFLAAKHHSNSKVFELERILE